MPYLVLILLFVVAVIWAYRIDFKKDKKAFIATAGGTLLFIIYYIIKTLII
jgi:uncharacterized membrane protein YozB (DUF420 family)